MMLSFRLLLLVAFAVLVIPSIAARADGANPPFRNPDLPVDQRVDDLVGRLTIDEKIGLLMMDSVAVPRLGIPAYHWWNEGLHGMARNGVATVFPQAIGLAATWDPDLHQKIADAISTEFRAKNNALILKTDGASKIYQGLTVWSPNINIFRDPRWGRGQETYGEDPFLTGRMAIAFVHGLQGNDPHYLKTVATLKHYAVHSGPEPERHRFDAVVSDRDLHETYLPAFEAGIREGGAQSLMSAYNAVDGIPAPANHYLLDDTLRQAWGFTGAVVGDVDTVADIFRGHHYSKDYAEASALALKAGTDLCSGSTYKSLPEALKRGLVTEADINLSLRRLLRLRFLLGQFDPADRVPYRKIALSENNSPAHSELALQAARESIVLLKNNGYLPWDPKTIRNLAILGPTGDDSAVLGNYSGLAEHPVTILKGIKSKLEPLGVNVTYNPAVPMIAGFREKGEPIPPGVLFTDASKSTPGLKGEVFDNSQFQGSPIATRTDASLDLFWNEYDAAPGIPPKNVNVRWTGVLVPPTTGEYALSLSFIGAANLYLDDKLIAGEYTPRDPAQVRTSSGRISLQAGHAYKVRIEFAQAALPGAAPNPKHTDFATNPDTTGKIFFGWNPPGELDDALAQAAKSDHVLLTLGITPTLEGEEMKITAAGFAGGDRTTIQLPQIQQDLIAKVAALGKPFAVVLTGSSSLVFDTTKPDAILFAWYYGQRGGDALAEELVGETNPSGHLPVTYYKSDADLPAFTDYNMANRTYRYFTGTPLYAFGYGLSYTTFAYDNLALSASTAKAADSLQLSLGVKNTGARAGDTVVQVYAHAVHPPVPMPLQALVAFQRVHLQPGEAKNITLTVPVERLRRWDTDAKKYVVDPGPYEFRVGAASNDAELKQTVQVD
jgi:beta-glucosidase